MIKANTAAIIGPGRIGKIYLRELVKLKYSEIFLYGGRNKPDLSKLDFIDNIVIKKNLKLSIIKN